MAGKVATGAALQFAIDQLGGPVYELESNPTIGAAVATVIEGSGDRVGLLIVNLGANDLYISLNSGVSSTNGIKLAASGGLAAFDVRDDFTLPARKFFGISPNGNTSVYVYELVRSALEPKAA